MERVSFFIMSSCDKEKVFYQPTVMSMSHQGCVFPSKHCYFVKYLERVEFQETTVSVLLSCTPYLWDPLHRQMTSKPWNG